MWALHPWLRFRLHAAQIAYVASAVVRLVCIHQLSIISRLGHSDAIRLPYDRSKVGCDHQKVPRMPGSPQKTQHARIGIVAIDPLEALPIEVHFMQRALGGVEAVQL